jgi:hypothetical protein
VYDEEEMHTRFRETSGGRDVVTFEQFIRFMVDETEDQNTAEQVFDSFKEVADGKASLSTIFYVQRELTMISLTSPNSTYDTLSSLMKSSMTSCLQCLSTAARTCKRTGTFPNTTTSPTWSGTWAPTKETATAR